jgi:hypothetical protein
VCLIRSWVENITNPNQPTCFHLLSFSTIQSKNGNLSKTKYISIYSTFGGGSTTTTTTIMFHRPSPSVRSTRMEKGILPPTIDTTSSDDGSCSDGSGSHSTIINNSSRSKSNTSSPDSSPRHNTNVNRPHQNNAPNGIFRPYHLYRIVAPLLWLLMGGAIVIIVFLGFGKRFEPSSSSSSSSSRFVFWNQPAVTHVRPRSDLRHPLDISTTPNTINSLRNVHGGSSTSSSIPDNVLGDPSNPPHLQCRWYLAESAIPHSGLGIFTGIGLHKNDMIGFPDICIFVHDPPDHWTHLRSHRYSNLFLQKIDQPPYNQQISHTLIHFLYTFF